MKVYKIKNEPDGSAIIVESLTEVADNLEGFEIGETIYIEIVDMDENEFYNLPEFEGF